MDRKTLYHTIEWAVAVAACGWLAWKMATYEDYASLWAALSDMGWKQVLALLLCVVLMPVNMGLEAWRWKTLWNGDSPITNHQSPITNYQSLSFREAQRQVYYSKLAGLVTPWKLGEYPARAVIMSEQENGLTDERLWARVLSMGAVGSATMTAAIIAAGMPAMFLDNTYWIPDSGSYLLLVGVVTVVLILSLAFAPRLLRRWATVSHRLVLISFGQSMARLICWCMQLVLVLYALGAAGSTDVFGKTAVYYLLVTVTPNVPVAEAGVRGAWAFAVFGTMNAVLAGVLLWGINTLLPCLIGLFVRKNN